MSHPLGEIMPKYWSENEKVKRAYTFYLEAASGKHNATIDSALHNSGIPYRTLLYPAEHAFTRDEGPRFDPEATDQSFAEMIRVFRDTFAA